MADTLNANASGAGALGAFIPEIWANSALEVLRNQIVLARLVSRDTDVATFTVGNVLNIPVPGVFTTNSKVAGTGVTLQNPSAGSVAVTLDHHEEVTFVIEDVVKAQANQDTIASHVRQGAVAIAEKIEADLFTLVNSLATNVGSVGVAAGASTVRSARKALNDNKAPLDGRFLVVGPQAEVDLLGDADLKDYFANAKPDAVSRGLMGQVYGMESYMSQLVPSSGTGATGVAGTKDFAMLAMRSLPVTEAPGVSQMAMRDPASGLVIRQTASYDTDLLGIKVTLDVLYGFTELRDACGVRFTTTK